MVKENVINEADYISPLSWHIEEIINVNNTGRTVVCVRIHSAPPMVIKHVQSQTLVDACVTVKLERSNAFYGQSEMEKTLSKLV